MWLSLVKYLSMWTRMQIVPVTYLFQYYYWTHTLLFPITVCLCISPSLCLLLWSICFLSLWLGEIQVSLCVSLCANRMIMLFIPKKSISRVRHNVSTAFDSSIWHNVSTAWESRLKHNVRMACDNRVQHNVSTSCDSRVWHSVIIACDRRVWPECCCM